MDLAELYFSTENPTSFSSIEALHRAAKRKGIRVTKEDVKNWLSRYDVYTLHKPSRYKFPTLQTVSYSFLDLAQADLAEMPNLSRQNAGVKYILVFICVLSKMLYLEPMKNKTSKVTAQAFGKLFSRMPAPPLRLQTDMGGEFWGKESRSVFKEKGIWHFSSQSRNVKASVAEVAVREVKRKLYKIMTHRKSKRYLDDLKKVEESHNARIHPKTKIAPRNVTYTNAGAVFKRLFPAIYKGKRRYPLRYSFKIGDKVRITLHRGPFKHAFYGNWSKEVFAIVARLPRDPPVYRIADTNGVNIKGIFYRNELSKVIQ